MTGDRLSSVPEQAAASAPCQAQLAFAGASGTRTYLRQQRVAYPFHVCRALYLPGDPVEVCSVYLQSCSGGIFEGDRLGIDIVAGPEAAVHVTTAASTIVHTMERDVAEQSVRLHAAEGSLLEYMPDPLILFPRSRLASTVRIVAHPGATVIACDSILAHDPAAEDRSFDWLRSEACVESEAGDVLAVDRFGIEGAELRRGQIGVHGPHFMQATLWVVHAAAPGRMLEALRSVLPTGTDVYAGASLLPGGCGAWVRALSSDAVALRSLVKRAWGAAREVVTGRPPATRRK